MQAVDGPHLSGPTATGAEVDGSDAICQTLVSVLTGTFYAIVLSQRVIITQIIETMDINLDKIINNNILFKQVAP